MRLKIHKGFGFTLIEFVIIVAVIGVISAFAVPRFVSLQQDSHRAAVSSTGGAFNAGVVIVHAKWLALGSPGLIYDFIPLSNTRAGGNLTVNAFGWPADTRGLSATLNNSADCVDVWNAVLGESAPTIAISLDQDYSALYVADYSCIYTYRSDTRYTITYDSTNGDVAVNL